MQNQNRKLIAFEDLNNIIIKNNFCTLCGACEATCPTHAIKIENGSPSRKYDCSKIIDLCPLCYDVCPHTETFVTEAHAALRDAPVFSGNFGAYRRIILAQTTDKSMMDEKGRGGAVVRSLLKYAIEHKIIDSAVSSELTSPTSIETKPTISTIPDDILSTVEGRLFPSPVVEAFGRAIDGYGKANIAFVGLPCHVSAIRKLEAWQHRFVSNLNFTIGLFCLWTFSFPTLLEYISKEYSIEPSKILRMDLTNKLEVVTDKETLGLSLQDVSNHIQNRCKTCSDFSAELSDISVGGAGSLKNWSVVIIRTKKGEEIFSGAVNAGIINIMSIDSETKVFDRTAAIALNKKEIAANNINILKSEGKALPPAVIEPWEAIPREFFALASLKIIDIMTKNVMATHSDLSVNQLLEWMTKYDHLGCPVTDEQGNLCGVVTFEDLRSVPLTDRDRVQVKDIMTKDVIVDFADDPVFSAFEEMIKHNIARIIIVDRDDPKKIRGIITRSDIISALQSLLR